MDRLLQRKIGTIARHKAALFADLQGELQALVGALKEGFGIGRSANEDQRDLEGSMTVGHNVPLVCNGSAFIAKGICKDKDYVPDKDTECLLIGHMHQ